MNEMPRGLLRSSAPTNDHRVFYSTASIILRKHLGQLIRYVTIGHDDIGDLLHEVSTFTGSSSKFEAPDGIKVMEGLLTEELAKDISTNDEFYIPWSFLCIADS